MSVDGSGPAHGGQKQQNDGMAFWSSVLRELTLGNEMRRVNHRDKVSGVSSSFEILVVFLDEISAASMVCVHKPGVDQIGLQYGSPVDSASRNRLGHTCHQDYSIGD